MAIQHVRALQYRRGQFDPFDYAIMEVIATDIGNNDEPAYTSLRQIAGRAGCHYNTVAGRVKGLNEAGQLTVTRKGKFNYYGLPDNPPAGTTIGAKDYHIDCDNDYVTREELAQLEQRLSHQFDGLSQRLSHIVTVLERFNVTKDSEVRSEEYTPLPPQGATGAGGGVPGKSKTQILVDHFCDMTGLKPPYERQKKLWLEGWLEPLNEILELTAGDVTAACGLIDRAQGHMRQNDLTIARPSSISSVARKLHSKSVPAVKLANGVDTAWTEVKVKANQRGTPAFSNPLILDAVRDIWPEIKKMTNYTEKDLRATFEQKYQELTHARH